jgi:hypothetical protein
MTPLRSKPCYEHNPTSHSANSDDWDCVLIHGYGKSGTKRLLRIFDFSPITHCRSEPYGLAGSPFQRLFTPLRRWIALPDDERLIEEKWDNAVQWCALRMGERDRWPPVAKSHHHRLAWHGGLFRLLASRKVRGIAGFIMPSLRRSEWLMPSWMSNQATLSRAILVLKINSSPGFATWVLNHRPRHKVIHLVRHPGAVLHSWSVRLLAQMDYDGVRRDNLERLRVISQLRPSWAKRFGDVESMSAEEAEMWFWLFCTETTHQAGLGLDQYALVLDEHVVQNAIAVSQRLFQVCHLPWSRSVETRLLKRAPTWQGCTACWRDLLKSDQVSLIERILDRSSIKGWWSENQLVSRIDYSWF